MSHSPRAGPANSNGVYEQFDTILFSASSSTVTSRRIASGDQSSQKSDLNTLVARTAADRIVTRAGIENTSKTPLATTTADRTVQRPYGSVSGCGIKHETNGNDELMTFSSFISIIPTQ